MRRYAEELYAALRARSSSGDVALDDPPDRRYVSQLIDSRQSRRFDRAWCRWVAYPRSLKHRQPRLFHILDQGYAHLIRAIDPERTIVTCHDVIPLLAARRAIPATVPPRVAWLFRRKVKCLERARMIIAVSAATQATLERYTAVDPRRITVIPYGLNATFRVRPDARAPMRAAAGLGERTPVVLQVATAGRYKNTAALLRALAQLRTRVPAVVLVRIGAPFFPDEAALVTRLGLAGCIRELGIINDDRVLANWYNAADLLMFPSSWEGFGWPSLEAMACGTPVVASNIPAVAEVVGVAGMLVPTGDSPAMADAAERVLTDPTLAAQLRQQGLERAAQFTWTAAATRTAALYHELLQA